MRSKTRAPAWNRAPPPPPAPRAARKGKKRNCGQTLLAPHNVRGESPLFLVVWANKPRCTWHNNTEPMSSQGPRIVNRDKALAVHSPKSVRLGGWGMGSSPPHPLKVSTPPWRLGGMGGTPPHPVKTVQWLGQAAVGGNENPSIGCFAPYGPDPLATRNMHMPKNEFHPGRCTPPWRLNLPRAVLVGPWGTMV